MTAAPAPRTQDERDLEREQKRTTRAALDLDQARSLRDQIAFKLWQEGMPQDEIAARLDRADRAAGGSGVAVTAVQKALYRLRKRMEARA